MQAEERQKRLEDYLQKVEFASLDELAQQVGVSLSTVRRDLAVLEATGGFQRTHGGARLVNPKSEEFIFSARDTHELAEKEAIGMALTYNSKKKTGPRSPKKMEESRSAQVPKRYREYILNNKCVQSS